MSTQGTSFEALAASPGDYAVDSEWMGDSPPALTVDFIQNPHNHIHLHQIDRIPKQQTHPFHGFNSAAAGGPGHGTRGLGKDPLLASDPTLTLSQPPTISSPESLLSSFQDSSSDISSSKQTSMSALSSLISGTPAKKGRGRPKGSGRSATTDASKRSAAGGSSHSTHFEGKSAVGEDDVMMSDGGLDASEGDNSQQNWSFRDYLRLDDDQENDEDDIDHSNNETAAVESDSLRTIDPKSIQRTPSFGGGDERLAEEVAAARAAIGAGAGIGSDLSPYSGGPSPLDFVSASSSPTPDDPTVPSFATQLFPASAATFTANSLDGSAQHTRKGHNKAASQYSLSHSMTNLKTTTSREVSPVSNFIFAQGPSFLQTPQSPDNTDFRFGFLSGGAADSMQMASNFLFPDSVPTSPTSTWPGHVLQHQQQQNILNNVTSQMPLFHQGPVATATAALMNTPRRPLRFFVGETPNKSRVETQIPVTIFLSALPPGVTKLHLPPYTVSKPKLLAKTPVEPSPDMLELHTMVVCTSAMQNEGNRRRALERAAAATHAPQSAHTNESGNCDDGDDGRPANGGEIWICKGCIQRERKRANRKKSKKPEDDEEWSREEHRRIIIFNTNEIKDWQRPTAASLSFLDENATVSPIEAVIDLPMRITCYCRHHGEKTGFQVIFTLKDFRGQVIAQTTSRSIMITDDHKTPTAPSAGSASAAASIADGDVSTGDVQDSAKPSSSTASTLTSKSISKGGKAKSLSGALSTPDLPALKRNSVTFSAPQPSEKASISGAATGVSSSVAVRALSRPASPDGLKGHSAKKRKSNTGVQKVPTGLAMTRIETSPQQPTLQTNTNAANRATSSTSPVAQFSSGTSAFLSPPPGFVPDTMAAAVDMALMAGGSGDPDIDSLAGIVPMNADPLVAGPLTPNSHTDQGGVFSNGNRSGSFDNLALSQTPMFSAPTSAHPSRAPSPNGLRGSMHMFQQQLFHQQQQQLQQQLNQAQFSQQFQTGLFSLPMALSQAATTPTSHPVIHKIIPAEGPKSGGIEVTILGSAFYQGLDVMFGSQRATTTTFWGESSLVCLVPPSSIAGHVPVTLRQSNQRAAQPFAASQQRITFKYLDDDEQQLLRAALTVLSRKMTGKIEDAQDVARRIIGSETANWGTSGGGNSGGSSAGSTRGVAGSSASLTSGVGNPNFETHLLKVLELIDLDDSSNQTRLNMQRRTTGHSMLHLACVLGMHRFVAGLLARGANFDVRDNGGYTPLHLAALNNQPEIVRRLIHAGADPTMRTLSGLTASEVAASREVLRAIKRFERHARSRSGGSLHSRTNSAASLRSLWEPMTMSTIHRRASGVGAKTDDTDDSENSSRAEVDSSSYAASNDDEGISEQEGDEDWLDMRQGSRIVSRGSLSIHSRRGARDTSPNTLAQSASTVAAAAARGANVPAALASPAAAAVSAFKEQLAAHFQQLVAQIPQIPTNPLPDYYQAYLNSAAFQRISSLVPNISGAIGSRPNSSGDNSGGNGAPGAKEFESRWWDLSSLMASSAPPPAYEEIFPHKGDLDTKQATAAAAAAEAEADSKCSTLYDKHQVEALTQDTTAYLDENGGEEDEGDHTTTTPVLQIGRKHQITKEQQENFRRVHKEKRKGLGSDTFLYTVWIPILLGVLLLWLSGARAWDFFPSVTFNVPYATSLSNPIRPTGTSASNSKAGDDLRSNQVLPPPPAVAAIPNGVVGGNGDVQDIIGGLDGIVA